MFRCGDAHLSPAQSSGKSTIRHTLPRGREHRVSVQIGPDKHKTRIWWRRLDAASDYLAGVQTDPCLHELVPDGLLQSHCPVLLLRGSWEPFHQAPLLDLQFTKTPAIDLQGIHGRTNG